MLGQIRRGMTPEINAISTVFLLLSIVIVTVFFLIRSSSETAVATGNKENDMNWKLMRDRARPPCSPRPAWPAPKASSTSTTGATTPAPS